MSIIKLENISKSFGNVKVLDNISLEVNQGEILGFIGPNGAGKTTTTRVLLGMYKADSGKAQIFGKDCWKDSVSIHEKIAFVPGDVNLWNNLTGGEVVNFFMRLNGKENTKRRDEYIKRFDLDTSKKCKTYSKGNRQKVALVAAFALDADVYIFDEPTSGLDPLMEKVFQECVLEEKKAGKTIILSSHILSEVESLCDKVAIIRKGKIIENGTIDSLRQITRNCVRLNSESPIENLSDLSGVHNVSEDSGRYIFEVDGSKIDYVINEISKYGIKNIQISPMSLEELFMHYYNED